MQLADNFKSNKYVPTTIYNKYTGTSVAKPPSESTFKSKYRTWYWYLVSNTVNVDTTAGQLDYRYLPGSRNIIAYTGIPGSLPGTGIPILLYVHTKRHYI